MLLVFDRARVPSVHPTQLSPSSLICATCRLGDLIMIISVGSIWKYFAILGPKKVVQRHAPRRPSVMQYWRFYDEKRENYFRLRKKNNEAEALLYPFLSRLTNALFLILQEKEKSVPFVSVLCNDLPLLEGQRIGRAFGCSSGSAQLRREELNFRAVSTS